MLLAVGPVAEAQTVTVNRCAGTKTRCVMGKTHVCGVAGVRGVLKCYQRADLRTSPVDPECLSLAVSELRDCFRDAERRLGDCLTWGDSATVQAKIDAFARDVVRDLDPNPKPNSNPCTVGKMKAVAEATAAKLGCFEDAFKRPPGTVDPACLAAPSSHLAYVWSRVEDNGGCLTTADLVLLEAKVDAFVADMIAALDP
jgi:hypothetical protein